MPGRGSVKFVHKRRIQAVGQDCQGFGYALILEFLCKVVRGDNDMVGHGFAWLTITRHMRRARRVRV